MKVVIDIPEVLYDYCKAQEDAIDIQLAVKNGTPLGTCRKCNYNYGLKHHGAFCPNDIVCAYWESDGLTKDDFCSRWKDKESE